MLVGEEGVAACLGNLDGVQEGTQVGALKEREIRVPSAPEVHLIVGLGDDVEQLRVWPTRRDERMRIEIAESATERHLSFG